MNLQRIPPNLYNDFIDRIGVYKVEEAVFDKNAFEMLLIGVNIRGFWGSDLSISVARTFLCAQFRERRRQRRDCKMQRRGARRYALTFNTLC